MRTWAYERKFVMPVRRLPSTPDLDHLKHQAKDLLRDHTARLQDAAQRLREFNPRFNGSSDLEIFHAEFKLSEAQFTIAREYGFPSWTRLKQHIERPTIMDRLELPHHERIQNALFREAVNLLDAGNSTGLRAFLRKHPQLIHERVEFEGGNYFRNPTLLEFIAENPSRRGQLPANIVEIAKVILDAGTSAGTSNESLNETLMLISTGSVARESGMQGPLINLLCDCGADPNSAAHPAALHGEFEALKALIERGARIDLPVAAALGRTQDAHSLLESSSAAHRHLALSLAADFGHVEIVRLLLDAGEDPNRYNPVGGHSHTTPLHQAAAKGHDDVVQLLIERGARTDLKDILWHATPAEWAHHEGKLATEAYLRDKTASNLSK